MTNRIQNYHHRLLVIEKRLCLGKYSFSRMDNYLSYVGYSLKGSTNPFPPPPNSDHVVALVVGVAVGWGSWKTFQWIKSSNIFWNKKKKA